MSKNIIRIVSILLILILLLILVRYKNTSKQTYVEGRYNYNEEVTIILPDYDKWYYLSTYRVLAMMSERFSYKTGIPIKMVKISTDDYIRKRNDELYTNNGPTLIFFPMWGESYKDLASKGVGLDIKDRIPNYSKIYDSLKDEENCYVPVGMVYKPLVLNKLVLNDLGIKEPSFDWNYDDYKEIRRSWLDKEPRYFTRDEFFEIINNPIRTLNILDSENKRVSFNNEKVKKYMLDVKNEIFSGKYKLNVEYTYSNYVNLIKNPRSKESYDIGKLIDFGYKSELLSQYSGNPLNTSGSVGSSHQIILPEVRSTSCFSSWGFMVNKRGKNVDNGLKFINEILSDEVQFEIFLTDHKVYPVNKNITKQIEEYEISRNVNKRAIDLKNYLLKQIENGEAASTSELDEIYQYIEGKFENILFDYIFKDESLTDEELEEKLQKIEDELNLWLSE